MCMRVVGGGSAPHCDDESSKALRPPVGCLLRGALRSPLAPCPRLFLALPVVICPWTEVAPSTTAGRLDVLMVAVVL